jgi:hypothetical protein
MKPFKTYIREYYAKGEERVPRKSTWVDQKGQVVYQHGGKSSENVLSISEFLAVRDLLSGTVKLANGKVFYAPFKQLEGALKENINKSSDTFYHITLTTSLPSIVKKGLLPLQKSNWVVAGTGKRYGNGNIFVFDHIRDAIRWGSRMDWILNRKLGSGNISIVELKKSDGWEIDTADPLSQASNKGKWWKRITAIPKTDIIKTYPLTHDMIVEASK